MLADVENETKFAGPSVSWTSSAVTIRRTSTAPSTSVSSCTEFRNGDEKGLTEFLPAFQLDGKRTLDENMADSGGLRQAYRAYRSLVQQRGQEARLPGLEHYTPDQIFFISVSKTSSSISGPELCLLWGKRCRRRRHLWVSPGNKMGPRDRTVSCTRAVRVLAVRLGDAGAAIVADRQRRAQSGLLPDRRLVVQFGRVRAPLWLRRGQRHEPTAQVRPLVRHHTRGRSVTSRTTHRRLCVPQSCHLVLSQPPGL